MRTELYFLLTRFFVTKTFFFKSEGVQHLRGLSPWSLLLAGEEGVEGDVGHLDNLEPDSGDVADGVALPAEPGDQDLVVLLHKVQATVLGHEGGDLLAVLDQLDVDALADGRVGLLGLNADLFENDSLGVRGTAEGVGLPPGAQMGLLVVLVGPDLVAPVVDVLTRSLDTCWLAHFDSREINSRS